jgi:hypothetical protein
MTNSTAGVSLTEIERESLRAPQQMARQAYTALISRVSVVVLPNRSACSVGSGVLLSTHSGTPFVLTARHLFEAVEGCGSLAIGNESIFLREAGDRVFSGALRPGPHDDEHKFVDVAAVSLVSEARERTRCLAGATLALESTTDENDVVVIAGFPSFLSRFTGHKRSLEVARLVYITGVDGRDRFGRLQVEWHEAKAVWDNPNLPYYPIEDGSTFELGRPHGISGGALWRVRGPRGNELWSPASHCQLIGVPVAVQGRIEFVEPVELWRAWLDDVEKEIDALAV